MTRANLAFLSLALVATLGSTGCGGYRHHARYGYMPLRMRAAVWIPAAAPAEPPAPAEVAPAPEYPAHPHPIVVHANVPGTTVIVVNPAPGAPPVAHVGPGAPAAPAAPAQQAEPSQQDDPNGWFEGE